MWHAPPENGAVIFVLHQLILVPRTSQSDFENIKFRGIPLENMHFPAHLPTFHGSPKGLQMKGKSSPDSRLQGAGIHWSE
jgi:hypothetical protein